LDLSEWEDHAVLLEWVVAEIDSLDWNNPQLLAYLRRRPTIQPKMLLQLLTYCYAIGDFGSDEIEQAFYGDKAFRILGWNQPPKIKAIGRFRRDNRGLLKWALVQVLKRAVRKKFDLGHRLLPGLNRCLLQNAIERIDLSRLIDRAAAED